MYMREKETIGRKEILKVLLWEALGWVVPVPRVVSEMILGGA